MERPTLAGLHPEYPQTAELFEYTRQVLMQALNTSAEQEIDALIRGLSGQFIEPGTSGAPTRF